MAAVARDLGVGWATVMRAVADHGTPLGDGAARLEGVAALGLDETSVLRATPTAPTRWITGLVDLERGRLLDLVANRTRAAVTAGFRPGRATGWPRSARPRWIPGAGMPARWSRRSAMPPWWGPRPRHPGWPTRWPTRHADRQQVTLGHRGPHLRPAVSHPQAAGDRGRAAHRAGTGAAAGPRHHEDRTRADRSANLDSTRWPLSWGQRHGTEPRVDADPQLTGHVQGSEPSGFLRGMLPT